MKLFNKLAYLCFMAVITPLFSSAQTNFFTPISGQELPEADDKLANITKYKSFRLEEQQMRTYLATAPMEFRNNGQFLPVEFPMPNGEMETFSIVESPILSAEIARQNPLIKTYTGNGTKNKAAIIRFAVTPHGFSAIILNVEGTAVYFEKYNNRVADVYFNYYIKDAKVPIEGLQMSCGQNDNEIFKKATSAPSHGERNNTGGTLRTYKLAMAATAEFTTKYGGQASTLSRIVTYVNTMNAVYRKELCVAFSLVSGTNLIYTNPATDPYTNNNQIAMLNENHANCNLVIGSTNYDIGHVMATELGSGGGIASFTAVCDDAIKGRGVSGEGDLSSYAQVFMDQLVLHEVGHQFGMSHSYNSIIPVCTTRNGPTSAEPGGGATIMSYGFTCGDDDYFTKGSPQVGPFLQFHTVSYAQAFVYITNTNPGYGGSCPTNTTTGNAPPVVTTPGNFTIPKSTPFALAGSATDPNGDALTYCWEGTDVGAVTPTTSTLADLTQPPFFRSYSTPDSATATRTFPLLSAVLNGTNYAKGDKLPSVGIVTNHRLVVRDNNSSGGGLSYAPVTVTIDGAQGPFLITNDFTGTKEALTMQTVTWSVNNTATTTPNVKITLSTDGGITFPITLLATTPNTGTASVTIPNNLTTTARIKVEAIGNIFFDISNVNFEISMAVPVELTYFKGSVLDKQRTELVWQTASEQSNKGFEVERGQMDTRGNISWKNIGFVQGAGDAVEVSNYNYIDKDLSPAKYYYRLKQIDFDGQFEYSNVINLQLLTGTIVSIHPNPTKGQLNIIGMEEGIHQYTVFSHLGQKMLEGTLQGISIDVSTLGAGAYILSISNEAGVVNHSFIKN